MTLTKRIVSSTIGNFTPVHAVPLRTHSSSHKHHFRLTRPPHTLPYLLSATSSATTTPPLHTSSPSLSSSHSTIPS